MISQTDVIVIGSGGLGAATAFYLVQRGLRNVALVDKHDIGSQTSPRAAGMVSCVRKGDLMIELIKLAAQKIKRFTQDTGQPIGLGSFGPCLRARHHAFPLDGGE